MTQLILGCDQTDRQGYDAADGIYQHFRTRTDSKSKFGAKNSKRTGEV